MTKSVRFRTLWMSFGCSKVSRLMPKKGTKNVHKLGKKTEKTECWKWELCTAMTCGRSKEETVEVVELGRTAIKSLEGQGAFTNWARSTRPWLLDWVFQKWHLQGATCKTIVSGSWNVQHGAKTIGLLWVSYSFEAFTLFCQKWKIVANTLLRANVWPPTAAL